MPAGTTPHGSVAQAFRPPVLGRRGMVCSGHPLASEAGLHVLRQGGNAVDAAIATGAALGVVEPASSGIGGDGFIMVRWAETGAVHVINATGAAPAGATVEAYAATGIPMKGIRSVSVPGILDGWLTAHDRFGTLSRNDVFAPAIELAEDGFPVSALLAREIAADESLRTFLSSRAIFMRDGRPLSMGETLFQRDLAMTYRAVADGGADVFYRGALAKAITACSVHYSGLLGNEDLAQYRATWQQAIATTYHGYDVYESPPNSSGHVLLQELNMVECFDFQGENIDSVGGIHVMVEAKKLAFADRERYMADPAFVDVPLAGLLSKSYAAERAKSIRMDVACTTVESGDPWPFEGRAAPTQSRVRRSSPTRQETTCLCVVDRWGNAVNILQSVQGGFGSGLVVEGTGILLNNRMTYWHLDPDHVDCLEPGKRVRHTMNTVMACKDGKLALVLGTPGADTQVQTNLQLLTHMLDAGYNPVEAVEAPRWRHLQNGTESTIPHDCDDELRLESRFPDGVVDELARLGHPVTRIGAWEAMGSAMVIQVIKPDGALAGAADPRKDGYALGW